MLDYRVYTFLEVCKTMNYTKASQVLNITQPNVTQHIRWLEERYGKKLFAYEKRRLVLTSAGELLKKSAISMAYEERLLAEQMEKLSDSGGKMAFGITKSVNESAMKCRIIELIQTRLCGNVYFYVDNTARLIKKMMDQDIDFAIVEGNFDQGQFDHIVLSREPFIPVRGREYRLRRPVKSLEDLCGERLIIREEGSGTRNILESILLSRNLSYGNFESIMEIGDISAIKMLLMEGCGITFMYATAIEKELEDGKLVEIPLNNLDVCHDFSLVWPRNSAFRHMFEALAPNFTRCREGAGQEGLRQ